MVGLNANLLAMLDNARMMSGIPFIITSGVRTEEENEEAGGVADSSHLTGLACDIACENDEQAFCIIYGACGAGFKRIGRGKGHIHLDIDPAKAQKVFFIEE